MTYRVRVAAVSATATACALGAWSCGATEFDPLQIRDQSPFVAIHGLPSIGYSRTLEAGSSVTGVAVDVTSNFSDAMKSAEEVVVDGETYRAVFSFRQGVGHGVDWTLAVPVVSHSGGFLDSLIRDWRLPTSAELQELRLEPFPSCSISPCIVDPVFAPTAAGTYWSSTSHASFPSNAWLVDFSNGSVSHTDKGTFRRVRAVRGKSF